MKNILPLITILVLSLMSNTSVFAQPVKFTKEELVEKSNKLFESGKAKDSIELIDKYPEFAEEPEVLYVKSVAYVDLRDFKNAEKAFQKQFELFLQYAEESRGITIKVGDAPLSKDDKSLVTVIYSTVLINFAMADMVNALRNVAFDKAGFTVSKRETKDLVGFIEFRKDYEKTALEAADFFSKNRMFKEAISNFSKVIEINPKNSVAYRGRAKIYRQQKKIKLAAADEAMARRYK